MVFIINQQIVKRNVQRFESLLSKVYRDSVIELINYIRKETDFYEAPASTQFHLACEGGLLQHSLNVYDCLYAKKQSFIWVKVLEDTADESIILVVLLHDLCKANFTPKVQEIKKHMM